MATAMLRSHDVLNNRMHLDAFTPSPTRPRRRRSPKPAGLSSSPPKAAVAVSRVPVVASSPPKAAAAASPAPKAAAVVSPPPKAAASIRRSPPPKTAARKQPSPTKEKPLVMEAVRILKRGEEPPAPAPSPVLAPAPVAQAAAVTKRVVRSTGRIGPKEPAVVPRKVVSAVPDVAIYAGPGFASAPEPSSLPVPGFCLRRAETEATRGLRCLLGIGQVA